MTGIPLALARAKARSDPHCLFGQPSWLVWEKLLRMDGWMDERGWIERDAPDSNPDWTQADRQALGVTADGNLATCYRQDKKRR